MSKTLLLAVILPDVLVVAGVAAIAAGCWFVPPLAGLVAGGLALRAALGLNRRFTPKPPEYMR